MKNNLLDAFNIPRKKELKILTDYEIFPDKQLLDVLRTKIVENIIDRHLEPNETTEEFISAEIAKTIEGYNLTNLEKNHIFNLINNEINGFGPLTELLEDDNITEIMVNGPAEIYIEVDGKIMKDESVSFINNEHILRTIERLIQPLGRTIDANNPMIDSRLSTGERLNAVIPPLSPKGPVITIRKYQNKDMNMDDLVRMGSLTPWMANFLQAAVKAHLNILICGSSGVGKTSLLNILSEFIENNERIITIEDTAELKLQQPNVIPLEAKYNLYEKDKSITIRDLVINSLRMRPDRIIVGEVRGEEAFDMLQAMNTGHDGSITTLHANSSQDALNRLETMVLMAGMDIPIKAIREYIKDAIDLIINVERMSDGKRKITNICEIKDMVDDKLILSDIFTFKQMGVTDQGEINGEYTFIEKIPNEYQKIKRNGITSVDDMFENIGGSSKEVKVKPNIISPTPSVAKQPKKNKNKKSNLENKKPIPDIPKVNTNISSEILQDLPNLKQ